MNYIIENKLIRSLRKSIDPASTEEQCYVLVGEWDDDDTLHVTDFHAVRNSHEDPSSYYRIVASDVPEHLLENIVGSVHTHLGEQDHGPSYHDVSLLPLAALGIVVHAPTLTITVYDATGFLETIA